MSTVHCGFQSYASIRCLMDSLLPTQVVGLILNNLPEKGEVVKDELEYELIYRHENGENHQWKVHKDDLLRAICDGFRPVVMNNEFYGDLGVAMFPYNYIR